MTVPARAGAQRQDERGVLRDNEIRLFVSRNLSYPTRDPINPNAATVHLGIGLHGWDAEPYVELSVPEASGLRAILDQAITLAQQDTEATR